MTIQHFFLWFFAAAWVAGMLYINQTLAVVQQRITADPALKEPFRRHMAFLARMRLLCMGATILMIGGALAAWFSELSAQQRAIAEARRQRWPVYDKNKVWEAPDPYLADTDARAELIRYGQNLVARTQDYYGPSGIIRSGSINGLNCQSCHLEAGSKPFGNNYFGVASTYPQMRARSGSLETIPKRINDCFERSLNGPPIDSNSREMKAIIAYMEWLGTGVPKGEKPKGAGLPDLPLMERAADPSRGEIVYQTKCATCHGTDGKGLPMPGSTRHYPPLWGDKSYNEGAGLYRLSRFASYVKSNMPLGASYLSPQLSDEEAWDVAAFVNSQPRPRHPFLQTDWPSISKKPFDHPFGPYDDPFPEKQHKYGPFKAIKAYYSTN